jgi:hypothetical protein
MFELFKKSEIESVYKSLKSKKEADRNKKMPIGVDGVSSEVFERNLDFSLNEIHRKLLVKNGRIEYKFAPLLRIERTKAQGGIRSLHVPRLRDQIVLRLIHNEIQRLSIQRGIDLKVKSPYSFVYRFDTIVRDFPDAIVLKTDISKFYDSIPRAKAIVLCESLGMKKELFEFLMFWSENLKIRLGNFYIDSEFSAFSGLPQGLSISSLLAELYVRQIDQDYKNHDGYFRYIDDIVIVCKDVKEAREKLEQLSVSLRTLGLKLSANKTEILRIKDGMEWLGLLHYPGRRYIHPDKLIRAVRPIRFIQKECMQNIGLVADSSAKSESIRKLIKQIDKYTTGNRKIRLRWYSLVEDNGQWKLMDKYIHALIYACIRKANVNADSFGSMPSMHSKILSYKKIRESQKTPFKGNAPSV